MPTENALTPEYPTAALRAAASMCLLLACAACSVFKSNEEAQSAVTQKVVGMRIGDFFERYGRASVREPQLDGSTEYKWVSETTEAPNRGFYGLDDRTCTLRLIVARDGRIGVASILQDMPGRTSTSRCMEIFKA